MAQLPAGRSQGVVCAAAKGSYRAYRFEWVGEPSDRPRVRVDHGRIYVSWNGATEVERWDVVAGPNPQQLGTVKTAAKKGFETAISVPVKSPYVAVRAVARDGRVLGTSSLLRLFRPRLASPR